MTQAGESFTPDPDAIQPVVLVGGQSRRFGRDKLREPVGYPPRPGGPCVVQLPPPPGRGEYPTGNGAWLVDRPIAALRAVFGPRVAGVGQCAAEVAARFDMMIPDLHPGAGPIGGVISALAHAHGPVFVLAGDLPTITPEEIRAVLAARPERGAGPAAALAAMAWTGRPEPCCALYLPAALPLLRQRLAEGRRSLHDALPPELVARAPVLPAHLINVNALEDLEEL